MGGYDAEFLGVPLALPQLQHETIELDYTNFSVLLDPARRIAAATAVNISGAELTEMKRASVWRLDKRVATEQQTGAELYKNNVFDRVHLVGRSAPSWGKEAKKAHTDTFFYTNAAPLALAASQGKELWPGLEGHVLARVDADQLRMSVFTGPVLRSDDARYRDVRIPRMFWKIAVWTALIDGQPQRRSTGFVLDQSPELADIDLRQLTSGNPPPLGPCRAFQVPVERIAELASLMIAEMADSDCYRPAPRSQLSGARSGWHELSSDADIAL
ncbi:MAG: DNA/RNA non-specific endonuclease [Rhodoglobus sp.]